MIDTGWPELTPAQRTAMVGAPTDWANEQTWNAHRGTLDSLVRKRLIESALQADGVLRYRLTPRGVRWRVAFVDPFA